MLYNVKIFIYFGYIDIKMEDWSFNLQKADTVLALVLKLWIFSKLIFSTTNYLYQIYIISVYFVCGNLCCIDIF